MSVRERFIELMKEKDFSQSHFCKVTGYSASGVTKFVTGRTQYPKQDFFEAVKKAWPDVNLNWLIMGEGPKYLTKGLPELSQLPEQKTVEELTRYNGPTYKDIEAKVKADFVSKEDYEEQMAQFDKHMDRMERILQWYIRKELIPKVRAIDPEAADEAEGLLGEME